MICNESWLRGTSPHQPEKWGKKDQTTKKKFKSMGQMNDIPNQVRKAEVLIELNLAKDIKGNTKGLYRFFCDNREDL